MNITILSIEGLEASATGWRLSRDTSTPVDWRDVFTVDVPVNELPTCHLLFEDFTILEREIFMTPRNHVAWARTSHVDDPLEFMVPEALAAEVGPEFIKNCRARMHQKKDAGASQDEWRENLPVISETAWTMRIGFRDLVKIAGYFGRLAADDNICDALRARLSWVSFELKTILDVFTGDYRHTNAVMEKYQKADFLHTGRLLTMMPGSVETAGFMVMGLDTPLWMRAQIIRHRNLSFVDTFYKDFLCNPMALMKTIKDPVRMELASTKDFWKSVLSKRGCWLAMDSLTKGKDLWAKLIDEAGLDETYLPCADGSCPYAKDAALRLTDADPGVPCPRYMNIERLDKNRYVAAMKIAATSRPSYWAKEIET